ncbi:MAG TPA: hypothetical protein VNU70_13115, partial [Puia sp.]|nr:hypothetical protein [Puia sp.]
LAIGQTLNIPLTAVNFSQTGTKASGETLIPVIHITLEKEWMYRISINHNKVPITSLEKWNNINKDQVHPGMHLIVGFLKVKTALSALAAPPHPAAIASTTSTTTTPGMATPKTDSPAGAPVHQQASPIRPQDSPVHIQASPTAAVPVNPLPITKPATTNPSAPHFDGGIFRSDFSDEGHSASGQAGVFKSTSGWQDGKYYALMNNITVGTVVRVTDPVSGKSVYTKVLGQLPDMKESAGLTIRISNAAAAELGLGDGRVTVQVSY